MEFEVEIRKRLEEAFDEKQVKVLIEAITYSHGFLVKAGDFNELKGIVRELAEA